MNITHRNYNSSWRRLLAATFALWACISALPWASALQGAACPVVEFNGQVQADELTDTPWVTNATMWGIVDHGNASATSATGFLSMNFPGFNPSLFRWEFGNTGNLELSTAISPSAVSPGKEIYTNTQGAAVSIEFFYDNVLWATGVVDFIEINVANINAVVATGSGGVTLTSPGNTSDFFDEVMALTGGSGGLVFTFNGFDPVDAQGLFRTQGSFTLDPCSPPSPNTAVGEGAGEGEGAGTPEDCEDAPLVVNVEFDSDTVGAESGHTSLVHSSTTDWTVVEDGGTKYYESTASQTNLKVEFPSTITLANGEALRVKVDYQYMSPPTDPGIQPFNFLRFGAYHDQGTSDYGDDVGYLADVSYWQQDTTPSATKTGDYAVRKEDNFYDDFDLGPLLDNRSVTEYQPPLTVETGDIVTMFDASGMRATWPKPADEGTSAEHAAVLCLVNVDGTLEARLFHGFPVSYIGKGVESGANVQLSFNSIYLESPSDNNGFRVRRIAAQHVPVTLDCCEPDTDTPGDPSDCILTFYDNRDDGPTGGGEPDPLGTGWSYPNAQSKQTQFLTDLGALGLSHELITFEQSNGWNPVNGTGDMFAGAGAPYAGGAYTSAAFADSGSMAAGDAAGSVSYIGADNAVTFSLYANGHAVGIEEPGIGDMDGSNDMDRGINTTPGGYHFLEALPSENAAGGLTIEFNTAVPAVGMYLMGVEDDKRAIEVVILHNDGSTQVRTTDVTSGPHNEGGTQFVGYLAPDLEDNTCWIKRITFNELYDGETGSDRDIFAIDDVIYPAREINPPVDTPEDCEDAPLVVNVEFDSDTVGAESGHTSLVHSSTTDWTVVEDGGTKYYESTASQTNLKVEFPSTITLANGEALRVKVDYQYMSPPTDPGIQPFNFLRFGAYHDQGTSDYGDDVGYLADVSYWQQDTTPSATKTGDYAVRKEDNFYDDFDLGPLLDNRSVTEYQPPLTVETGDIVTMFDASGMRATWPKPADEGTSAEHAAVLCLVNVDGTLEARLFHGFPVSYIGKGVESGANVQLSFNSIYLESPSDNNGFRVRRIAAQHVPVTLDCCEPDTDTPGDPSDCILTFYDNRDDGPTGGGEPDPSATGWSYPNAQSKQTQFLTDLGALGLSHELITFEQSNGWNPVNGTGDMFAGAGAPYAGGAYTSAAFADSGSMAAGDAAGSVSYIGADNAVTFSLYANGHAVGIEEPGIGDMDGSNDMDRGINTTPGGYHFLEALPSENAAGGLTIEFNTAVPAVGMYLMGVEDDKRAIEVVILHNDGSTQVRTTDVTSGPHNEGGTQFVGYLAPDLEDNTCWIKRITFNELYDGETGSDRDIFAIDDVIYPAREINPPVDTQDPNNPQGPDLPKVVFGNPSPILVNQGIIAFPLTYENVTDLSLILEDVQVVSTGLINFDPNVVLNESGDIPVIEVMIIGGDGTLALKLPPGAGTDAQGQGDAGAISESVVVDNTPPTLTLLGASTHIHAVGTDYSDGGARASDNLDTDVAVSFEGKVDGDVPGTYILTYEAVDSAGNVATPLTRTVNVKDQSAPIITLNGDAAIVKEAGAAYVDSGATATDNVDATVTVLTGGAVDESKLGTYTLTYNASDTAGNAATEVTREVSVVDTIAPVVTLLGDAEIIHVIGTSYSDPGAQVTDSFDQSLTYTMSGEVNPEVLGTYKLIYSARDSSHNEAIVLERIVTVTDGLEVSLIRSTFKTISENGGKNEITVSLSMPALADSVPVSVVATPASRVKVPAFVPVIAGDKEFKVSIEGLDDTLSNGDEPVTIQLRTPYRDLGEPIEMTIQDDDLEAPVAGTVSDGLISGATVFFDRNANRVLDADEPSTQTDNRGGYQLNLPASLYDSNGDDVVDSADGVIVARGGIDTATGLTLETPLLAPPSATVINPITTLVSNMIESDSSLDADDAAALVQSSLGIGGVDVLNFDMFEEAGNENPAATEVIKAAAKVQDTIVQAGSFISGASTISKAASYNLISEILVKKIKEQQPIELNDVATLESVVEEAAMKAQVVIAPESIKGAAAIISDSNQLKESAVDAAGSVVQAAQEISRVQGHAQSESQSDLADLGAGIQSLEALEIKYEADNLEKLVEETAVGPVSGVDERVGTFAFSSADYEVNESGEAVSQIKITREEGNLGVVDLLVTPQALTASSDEDFVSAPIAVRFEDQEITKTLSLEGVLIDDQITDAGESFTLQLGLKEQGDSPAKIGAIDEAEIRIIDNDFAGIFQFKSASNTLSEAETGEQYLVIERVDGNSGEVTLELSDTSVAGGALAGADYTVEQTSITFGDGVLQRKVSVSMIDDELLELDESFRLTLSLPSGDLSGALLGTNASTDILIQSDELDLAPWVSAVEDIQMLEDGSEVTANFTVNDDYTAIDRLRVSATSSNISIIPGQNLTLAPIGDGGMWQLGMLPLPDAYGEVLVSVRVSDGINVSLSEFSVSVQGQNDAPAISAIPAMIDAVGKQVVIPFELTDIDHRIEDLLVYFDTSQTDYIASRSVDVRGTGVKRDLVINPTGLAGGTGFFKLTVVDGAGARFSRAFTVHFGGEAPQPVVPELFIERDGANGFILRWEGDAPLYTSHDLTGSFEPVPDAVSPYRVDALGNAFFKLGLKP